jgi:hypothetical protein
MPDAPTSNPEQFYQGAPLLLVPDVCATTVLPEDPRIQGRPGR